MNYDDDDKEDYDKAGIARSDVLRITILAAFCWWAIWIALAFSHTSCTEACGTRVAEQHDEE